MKEIVEEIKKERLPLTLDIQYFAEGGEVGTDGEGAEGGAEGGKDPEGKSTFTQSEVDSQISKAVEKALQRKQADFDKKLEEKLAAERKSAEDYAKMTAKEKEEAKYQERLKELEAREKEINSRELLTQIETDLKDNELPLSFATSLLNVGDNEKIKESIAGIKKDFDAAVNDKVKEALRQDTPNTGGSIKTGDKTLSIGEVAKAARIIK